MRPSQRSNAEGESQPEQTSLDYHPEAIHELIETARFYEERQSNLGNRFLDAVDEALATLQMDPLLWQADEFGRRTYRVKKFPYLLIYKIGNNSVFILAVAHTRRKPGYWKERDV